MTVSFLFDFPRLSSLVRKFTLQKTSVWALGARRDRESPPCSVPLALLPIGFEFLGLWHEGAIAIAPSSADSRQAASLAAREAQRPHGVRSAEDEP
jgi:hypothetical protein